MKSIIECDFCRNFPHKQDLACDETEQFFNDLILINSHNESIDRYTHISDMIKKCKHCGTYYHHHHSLDNEDAFVAGPHIQENIQRYNLLRLRIVLSHIKATKELALFDKLYPLWIKSFTEQIQQNNPIALQTILPYYIENLIDYYFLHDDWRNIKNNLLENANSQISLATIEDIIVVFGEICQNGFWPFFTYYRDFTTEIQHKCRTMLKEKSKEFIAVIKKLTKHNDPSIQSLAKKRLNSAKYYKLIKNCNCCYNCNGQ